MSNDITITTQQFNDSLNGVITQLKASGIAKNHDSFAHAMEDLNMWDYVNNQANVDAYANAYNTKLYSIIHNNTHK